MTGATGVHDERAAGLLDERLMSVAVDDHGEVVVAIQDNTIVTIDSTES